MGRTRPAAASLIGALAWLVCLSAAAQAPAAPSADADAGAATPSAQPAPATPADPSAAPAEPDAATQEAYRQLVAQGVAEFDGGRFAEARARFLQAHELWPNARTLRVLGMTSFELRSYVQAQHELRAALADTRKPLNDAQRAELTALLEQTAAFVGRYRVVYSPASATLLVDGNPAALDADGTLQLEVGSHELLARAEGHAERRMRVLVQGREDTTLAFELVADAADPTPQPEQARTTAAPPAATAADDKGTPLWPFLAGGGALLGGVAVTTFLITDAKADCADNMDLIPNTNKTGCTNAEKADIQRLDAVWISSAIASGVLLTASAVLWLGTSSESDAGTTALLGPGYVGLAGRF